MLQSTATAQSLPRANLRRAPSDLASLIAAMRAAGAEYCRLQEIYETASIKVKAATPAIAGVFCSMIEDVTIIAHGKTNVIPGHACYYRTEESIERDNSLTPEKATAARHELLAQIADAENAVPVALREELKNARNQSYAAANAFDRAEAAVAKFKPTTAADAAELLEIVTNPRTNTFSDAQSQKILKNIAQALRSGGLR